MSVLSLPRVVLYRINYSSKTAVELDPNDRVYCSGKYKNMAQWKYDLTALQVERAGREMIISRVTASWYTSAKYTYDIRIQTGRIYEKKSGWYFGDATGTSKDSMQQISTTRYAGYDTVTAIQSIINSGASEIYMSCENESSPSGYGTCQYGELIIEYEYATPLKVINYLTCDSSQAVQGDTINYTASIRNINKEDTITSIQLELVRVENGVDISVGDAATISRTLQPGELAEINREITIPSWANPARSTDLYLKATIAGADPEKELLCNVLDKKYNPTIENFQVYRSRQNLVDGSWIKSENGIHTLTDLKIYIGEGATGFTLYAYYAEDGEPDIASEENRISLSSKIDSALTGFEKETNVIDRTDGWGLNSNWHFALVLTDGYETARVDAELAKAFANMHLAGLTTGGVRFGGYCSRSTQDNPAFECSYPAYFDAGIISEQYQDGDVITLTGGAFYGYVTNGTEYIRFNIPLRKSLEKINSATITTLRANIANAGGYGITSSFADGGSDYIVSGVSCTCTVLKETNEIFVALDRSSGFALTNNDNVSVRYEQIVITLNE